MANCDNNPWKKNAWGKKEGEVEEPIVSFVDVMSEEFIEDMSLQEKLEDERYIKHIEQVYGDSSTSEEQLPINTEGMTDEEVALALQRQFDREYDVALAVATSSSVHIAPDRYHPKTLQETDSEDEDDDALRQAATNMLYAKLDADDAARLRPEGPSTSRTKHDTGVSGRRNADKTFNVSFYTKRRDRTLNTKILKLQRYISSSSFQDRNPLPTGDMVNDKLNNKVYNRLMAFGKSETKRQMRHKDKEEKATMETSVDSDTRLLLLKWINQGVFDSVNGIIATGKESAVLHAQNSVTSFAIKVYKTTLSEFKNRSEYVKDDFRFKNPRAVLKIWAEREHMNLSRMAKKHLPCPQPIEVRKNILVMSFIGDSGLAAPRLKNVDWDFFIDEEVKEVYDQVQAASELIIVNKKLINFQIMIRMYKECDLVHADLSEFNLLLAPGNKVHVIDVSQAMDLSHPRCLQFLTRDIHNILSFFNKIGSPNLPTDVTLFNMITDLEMVENEDLLVQVEQFSEENRSVDLRHDKSRPADMELKKYNEEKKANRGVSPAREYN
ncbi:CRE-RIOK-3 protein [Caenorhabditis remanei]|uniref:Serine/threonine-protein kinase RIO3 n=1 Tax=Caenorhabditis remanei TaxID=31234 RepID=E3LS67_CAERE|nr:CRE-RIOK-3 protein [Caenorhabditis remanei]